MRAWTTRSPPAVCASASSRIDGQAASWDWSGWGSGQADVETQPATADVAYRFGDARIVLTPGFVAPENRPPLAVAVDPDTAARAGASGRMVLTVNGQSVPAQIVAVLPRFPVGSQHFLLADRPTVVSLLNQITPGTAFVSRGLDRRPGGEPGHRPGHAGVLAGVGDHPVVPSRPRPGDHR